MTLRHPAPATRASASVLSGLLLSLAASSALAATVNVTCVNPVAGVCTGTNLNQIIENAGSTDTISVAPGIYTAQGTTSNPSATYIQIRKPVQLVSTGGAAVTTLRGSGGAGSYAVRFFHWTPVPATNVDGALIDGFTLDGSDGGVEANAFLSPANTAINNITIKNLVVNSSNLTASNGSHGVSLSIVNNSRVDGVRVATAYNNGIYDYRGNGNLITNSTVQSTSTQHGIALSNTTNAWVVGNTVTGSGFHGIIGLALTDSRIERNTLSGFQHDGITITKDLAPPAGTGLSASNFIGHNIVNSSTWANNVFIDGTGIFLNCGTNGHYLYANKLSGSPENGVALFGVKSTYVQANRIHGNYQGGVLVWNNVVTACNGLDQNTSGKPTNTFIRNNFIYNNPLNAMVNLRGTQDTDVGFNFLSGANFPGDPAIPADVPGPSAAGYSPSPGGIVTGGDDPTFAPTGTKFHSNSVMSMTNAEYFFANTTATTLFRNRQFGVMDKYSISPAGVTWHGGSLLGGNYWSGHAANGNPSSGATPYTTIIYGPGQIGGPYADTFPYAAETLGETPSVAVDLPRTGSQVAAGSLRTIRWASKGCVYVDIQLLNNVATPIATLATNWPDTGHFVWSVPGGQAAGTHSVRVTCKNSGGVSTGAVGTSGTFSIFAAGLTLLTPGPYAGPTAAGPVTVAWARGAGVTGTVNVFLSVDGGAETQVGTNIAGNYTNITLPNSISNRAVLRIVTGSNQDSTDGHFTIRRATGMGFTGIPAGANLPPNSRQRIEWTSPPTSRYVTLEAFNGSAYVAIATDLPDFNNFEWLVDPAFIGSNRNLRVTFKSAALAQVSQATSNNFNVLLTTDRAVTQSANPSPGNVQKDVMFTMTATNNGPGASTNTLLTAPVPAGSAFIWASPGCSHAAGTVTCAVGTLSAGSSAVFKTVVRPTAAGSITQNVTISGTETDAIAGNNTAGTTVTVNTNPVAVQALRYRLFSPVTSEHLYTTDLNEYNVLGALVGTWVQEGTVGKVLNNPGSFGGVQATPYYRLYNTSNAQHHWTTDPNEYYTLILFPQYNAEGVDGYILPTQGTGSVPLFRLLYPFTVPVAGLHHWTIDAAEYNALITSFGWVGEGGSGFVIP